MGQPETTFGASITRPHGTMAAEASLPALTPAASHDSLAASYVERPVPPYSPFYQHPPASHERVAKPQLSTSSYNNKKTHLDVDIAERGMIGSRDDLTPLSAAESNPFCSKISVGANKECTMWPSRQTLASTKLTEKQKKRSAGGFCACAGLRHKWEQLDRRQRLTIRIVCALVLVGAMIGLGVGISKAVNGSYYSGGGNQAT